MCFPTKVLQEPTLPFLTPAKRVTCYHTNQPFQPSNTTTTRRGPRLRENMKTTIASQMRMENVKLTMLKRVVSPKTANTKNHILVLENPRD